MRSNTKRNVRLRLVAQSALALLLVVGLTACKSCHKKEVIPGVGIAETTETTTDDADDREDVVIPGPVDPKPPKDTTYLPPPADRRDVKPEPELQTVYFDYDSDLLRQDTLDILRVNAAWLIANPDVSVQIEGHCDERGTREYNAVLGARRANSVVQTLIREGVASDRLHPISYGEDQLVSLGNDEASHWQNRRVEFKRFVDK